MVYKKIHLAWRKFMLLRQLNSTKIMQDFLRVDNHCLLKGFVCLLFFCLIFPFMIITGPSGICF